MYKCVDQHRLGRALEAVVDDAVNAVGVDHYMPSTPLLAHVSRLSRFGRKRSSHRNEKDVFRSRKDLLRVPRLGPRAFEQCAGFLRIQGGGEPLDASAVHSEAYALAKRIVAACGRDLRSLRSDETRLNDLDPATFVDDTFGLPIMRDILAELAKPGRDPRPGLVTANFAEGVHDIRELKADMMLGGTVTNVAAFGTFVDVGVHQDGLVGVVKAGDVVRVRVLEVDVPRQRIGL